MKNVTIAALAAAFAMGSYAHAANLITNGSFEEDVVFTGNKSWEVFPNGLTGWEVTKGEGIELQTEPTLGLTPQDGDYYAELDSHPNNNGSSNSRIEQILNLGVGSYQLSFYFAPRTGNPATDGIMFGADGKNPAKVTGAGGMVNGDGDPKRQWQLVTYEFFVETAGPVSIFFEAGGTADTLGGFIDDIELVATPLPGAAAFLLTGLAGLGMARRKRAA